MPISAYTTAPTLRKRAVNLSATMEVLLADYVTQQQQTRLARQKLADACVTDWNALHAKVGSFADAHSTL